MLSFMFLPEHIFDPVFIETLPATADDALVVIYGYFHDRHLDLFYI